MSSTTSKPKSSKVTTRIDPSIVKAPKRAKQSQARAWADSEFDKQYPLPFDATAKSARIVTVTPTLALAMLHYLSTDNRKQNSKSEARIANDLNDGNFLYTGHTLKFSTEGALIDGQNILRAIISTGKTVDMLVATGITPEARLVTDTGKTYTLKDALVARGVPRAQQVATVLTAVQAYERGDHTSEPLAGATTIPGSLAFLEKNPRVLTVTDDAFKLSTRIDGYTLKDLAALVWTLDTVDRDARVAFFNQVERGYDLDQGHPIFILRTVLADQEETRRYSARQILAITVKAWNLHRKGERTNSITFSGGGKKADDFPIAI